MAQMRVALGAQHLGAPHEQAGVRFGANILRRNRPGKAWPSGAGIELRVGIEQWFAAAHAGIGSRLLTIVVFAGERPLRALLPGDSILLRGELLFPLLVAFP